MIDKTTLCEIKRLDELLKSLSGLLNENDTLNFSVNLIFPEKPFVTFFDLIQEVFGNSQPKMLSFS